MSDSAGAPKLFISYRRDETPVSAAWLYEVLVERFGESSVFMDLTLKPGEDFVERITEVLGVCHILLVVMGPRWAAPNDSTGPASIKDPDDFVRLEVEVAMARPDVEVLPVLVGGANMPHRDELPEKIQGLTRIQAKEMTNQRRAADMADLVGRIEELLPPETMARPPKPRPSPDQRPRPDEPVEDEPQRRPRPRWLPAGAAAAGLIAVIAIAALLLSGGSEEPDSNGESESRGQVDEGVYDAGEAVTELDVRADTLVYTTGEEKTETLTEVDLPNRRANPLTSEPTHFNGIDVGTDNGGHAAVVATICSSDEECDVHSRRDGAFMSENLAPGMCKAVRPSMSQGTILFSLEGDNCGERGLYTYRRGETDQLTPQRTKGADIDGDTAVAIRRPRALQVHDLSGDDLRTASLQLPEGHEPWGPVVVDGEYVYFLDLVGSSYWIARIQWSSEDPALEHYGLNDARVKPSFGVTDGVLYASGLSRGKDVIVPDAASSERFEPVEDAVERQ